MSNRRGGRLSPAVPVLNRRGVTLIETVAALGLFAISMASVGGFLVHQVHTSANNNIVSLAYAVAEEELEALRALDYSDIGARESTQTRGNLAFQVATAVENDTPAANMKQITVDVSWDGADGTQNVTAHTIYTGVRR